MSSISINIATSRAQDLFYQDYAPRDAFFSEDDFKFHFVTIYSSMLDEMFQAIRRQTKQEEGFSNVELTRDWLVTEVVDVKDGQYGVYEATPSSNIFGFSFDSFVYSLDQIKAIGGCGNKKCTIVKISADEARFLDLSPTSSVIYAWVPSQNTIRFSASGSEPQPLALKSVEITYLPSINSGTDNCIVSEVIASKVIVQVLDLFFKTRQGTVIDESNDGNKSSNNPQNNPALSKLQANAAK